MKKLRASQAALCLLTALLAACGGGGGAPVPPQVPPAAPAPPETGGVVPLPAQVTITAPAQAEIGELVSWQNSLPAGSSGLTLEWDFGDGTRSSQTAPSHAYARSGTYETVMTVRNAAGESRVARKTVTVAAFAMVAGRNCSGAGQSGWCWMSPLEPVYNLDAVVFTDALYGWALDGDRGVVRKTVDGGLHWTNHTVSASPLSSEPPRQMRFLSFADSLHGVASNTGFGGGQVMVTHDGGQSWAKATLFSMNSIKWLWMLDSKTIVVTGYKSCLPSCPSFKRADSTLISVDGGVSWRDSSAVVSEIASQNLMWSVNTNILLSSVTVALTQDLGVSAQELRRLEWLRGFARPVRPGDTDLTLLNWEMPIAGVEYFDQPQWITRISEQGSKSTTVRVQVPGSQSGRLLSATYRSATEVWGAFALGVATGVAGEPLPRCQQARSGDGGATWALIGAPTDAVVCAGQFRLDGTSWAWALPNGRALLFNEGDLNARNIPLPEPANLPIEMVRPAGGPLLLRHGDKRWYRFDEASTSWSALAGSAIDRPDILRLISFNSSNVLAADANGALQRTTDGGRNWAAAGALPADAQVAGLQITPSGGGWVIAANRLWRTADGGSTWQTVPSAPQGLAAQVQAVDDRRAWLRTACASDTTPACQPGLHLTSDGGATWRSSALPNGSGSVQMLDDAFGVTLGERSGGCWVTQDGGRTWVTTDTTLPRGIERFHFADRQRGWAVSAELQGSGIRGGNYFAYRLQRTMDGGRTWTFVDLPVAIPAQIRALAFADAHNGWLVGDSGLVLATTDGGETWSRQESEGTASWRAIAAFDAATLWLGGSNSAIVASATGGR